MDEKQKKHLELNEIMRSLYRKEAMCDLLEQCGGDINALPECFDNKKLGSSYRDSLDSFSYFQAYLLESNIYGDPRDYDRRSKADIDTVKMMIEEYGADVNKPSKKGLTPLMLALATERYDIFELLLKHGANINYTHTFLAPKGMPFVENVNLFHSICNETVISLDALKYVLDNHLKNMEGEPLSAKTTKNMTPVAYALKNLHNFEKAIYLLDRFDFDKLPEDERKNAINLYECIGRDNKSTYLHGLINTTHKYQHYLDVQEFLKVARCLTDSNKTLGGINLNEGYQTNGLSIIGYMFDKGVKYRFIKPFIEEFKPDLTFIDGFGRNLFHILAIRGCDSSSDIGEIVQTLFDAGVDINKKDDNGNTPLALTFTRGDIQLLKSYIDKGALTDDDLTYFGYPLKLYLDEYSHSSSISSWLNYKPRKPTDEPAGECCVDDYPGYKY